MTLIAQARELLKANSKDKKRIRELLAELRCAYEGTAGEDQKNDVWDALYDLTKHSSRVRVDELLARLGPCPYCQSLTYRVSDPLELAELVTKDHGLPQASVFVVVCLGCGHMSSFLDDVDMLEFNAFFDTVVKVKAPKGGGPYR